MTKKKTTIYLFDNTLTSKIIERYLTEMFYYCFIGTLFSLFVVLLRNIKYVSLIFCHFHHLY